MKQFIVLMHMQFHLSLLTLKLGYDTNVSYQQVQQTGDLEFITQDEPCSHKAIELFCTKVKTTHNADTAQKLLTDARVFQCGWFEETIGKDESVPQHVKDTIREKIACPVPQA